MSKVIAMAGKGGTGKTTITALLLKYLIEKQMTPVLAVDADANANLNELLELVVETTLGQIREEMKGDIPHGMNRNQFMEMRIHQAMIEEKGFDLIVMGQPDGPGCYCAANNHLAMTMDKLAGNYKWILVDNEAGMEHLSRMNLRIIDHMFIISDSSARGIMTAGRIADITGPLKLDVKKRHFIVNRAPDPVPADLQRKIDETVADAEGIELAGIISSSDELIERELSGKSYLAVPGESEVIKQTFAIFDSIFT
jgi:CO dehydrogenase maturation factor